MFELVIQGFNGCTQFPSDATTYVGIPSKSIFVINDYRHVNKVQIAENILGTLRANYLQRHGVSLGRVFEIKATCKGNFEIRKGVDVF